MSGWDGFREKWRRHVTRVAGVALRDNTLHVVGLEWRDEAWEASFFCHVMLQAPEEELVQDLAEKTACLLAQKGWEQERVVFALPEGMATVFEESFPPGTEPEELQEMARYEGARALFGQHVPRGLCASRRWLTDSCGGCRIAARVHLRSIPVCRSRALGRCGAA